ncbi:MAG: helix-turn-helix domain-containing protein [Oscillospiraceae bacterium]|nr:helix-turn-helix domain-containing protein [Oscillospiraceae bacterium]
MTQKQVAAALGIGESSYCSYENGTREPNYQMLIKIADFFDVSLDYLLNHKISETDFTMSPENLEILKKYYAMELSARNLVNRLMDLVRNYESRIPHSSGITVSFGADPGTDSGADPEADLGVDPEVASGTDPGADPEDDSDKYIFRIASRDGDGIREESVTPEQIRKLKDLEALDDDL